MKILYFLFSTAMVLWAVCSFITVRKIKKQLSELLDALTDIRLGNGNRRILAKPHEICAPLAYEINDIVVSYENKLCTSRRTEEAGRQLMTNLSHDVRTPLTTLTGYLDAAHKKIVTGEERDAYIETALKKSHDLKEYIDMLFDWFKLNSDEFVLKMDTVETAELTRTILIDWIPVLEDRQISYDIVIPEQPLPARLDADGYRRILNNLIQNVVAHSQADKIKISLCEWEHQIKIQISDNGIGMKSEDLKRIFERLYRCDNAGSNCGSGLGLSIAYQLTEKMNGIISAESEPANGTTFTLLFPMDSKRKINARFLQG